MTLPAGSDAGGDAARSAPTVRFASILGALVCLLWSHRTAIGLEGGGAAGSEGLDDALFAPSMMAPAIALAAFVVLAFRRRERIAEALAAGRGSGWGAAVLGLGVGVSLWARQIDAERLLVPSLILHLIGGAVMIGGRPLVAALGMPLLALSTAIALPPSWIQAVVFPLQLWTVSLASFLLGLMGRSHEVLGDLVLYRGDRFQVIEGCSGFKTIVSLVLAAIVYGDFVATGRRMRIGLIALAIPIGVLANGVRVTGLIVGRITPESAEHAGYGILAIVGGVLALFVLELSSTRLWGALGGGSLPSAASGRARSAEPSGPLVPDAVPPSAPETSAERSDGRRRGRSSRALIGAATGMAVVSMVAGEVVPRGAWPAPSPGINIETLPESIDGRAARPLTIDDAWLGSVRFAHRIYRSYDVASAQDDSIRVFVGLDDIGSAERTGDAPKTIIPRSGWQRIESLAPIEIGDPESASLRWERRIIDYPNQRLLVLRSRTGFAPWGLEGLGRWVGFDRAGFMGARRSPLVLRLEMDTRPGDEQRDWMIVRQFAEDVSTWAAAATR